MPGRIGTFFVLLLFAGFVSVVALLTVAVFESVPADATGGALNVRLITGCTKRKCGHGARDDTSYVVAGSAYAGVADECRAGICVSELDKGHGRRRDPTLTVTEFVAFAEW